ncbi:hypothetical protein IWX50DRAFT_646410 [Phyllosticta citricarpa]
MRWSSCGLPTRAHEVVDEGVARLVFVVVVGVTCLLLGVFCCCLMRRGCVGGWRLFMGDENVDDGGIHAHSGVVREDVLDRGIGTWVNCMFIMEGFPREMRSRTMAVYENGGVVCKDHVGSATRVSSKLFVDNGGLSAEDVAEERRGRMGTGLEIFQFF